VPLPLVLLCRYDSDELDEKSTGLKGWDEDEDDESEEDLAQDVKMVVCLKTMSRLRPR